jgi:PKD repeat protein
MKKSLLFTGLFLSSLFSGIINIHAQCPNLNFSMGNFANWQGYLGSCDSGNISINPTAITPGRHTIMDGAHLPINFYDERCPKIKKVPDGFAYSAKIGNEAVGAEMEAIEYTMTVDSTNSLLLIHFAYVMQYDSNHSLAEQSGFSMIIKDTAGNLIVNLPCGEINFAASPDLKDLACNNSIIARDWTSVGYSLESLIGQTIKIYFETRDCINRCHFGYAYVVAECRPMTIELHYCEGQTAARLRAPDGFAWYKWTRSSMPDWSFEGAGRNYQQSSITNPSDGEIFTCEVTSAIDSSCTAILNTTFMVTSIDVDFAIGTIENGQVDITRYDTCDRTATFVDLSTITHSKKSSVRWTIDGLNVISRDSLFTYTFPKPIDNNPVTYVVRLRVTAENGCSDTSSRHITIYPSLYLDSVRVNSVHAHFTTQQEVLCNYTNITFTNNSFADVQTFINKDCRIDPDTNVYLNCEWDWGDGAYSYQRFANGTNPTIETKYFLPNTETKVVVTLKVRIEGFDFENIYRDTLTILPRPTASFTDDGHVFSSCSEPEDGSNNRKIRFINQSQGNIEQLIWNFGDGTEISGGIDDTLITNPVHAYKNEAGEYDILLVAIDSNQCRDSLRIDNHVSILGVKGNFSYWDTIGCAPITVTFSFPDVYNLPSQYMPDSIVVHTGGASDLTRVGLPPFFHSRSTTYIKPGNYLPICYIYKTVNFNGKEEQCILEVKGKDSIRLVQLIHNFDIMEYYFPDSPVVFTNASIWEPEGLPYDSVIWNFGNGDFSYDFDGRTIYSDTGKYSVTMRMKVSECVRVRTRTINVIEKSGLPVSDITNRNSSVIIYPNPASTQLFIKHSFQENTNYSIYNILGESILQGSLHEEISIVNIESLSKGIYYLKISGKENAVMKFVKE